MALDRTWYDTLQDDDGSNTVGTVWDKADVDSLMDAIDAELFWSLAATDDARFAVSGVDAIRVVKDGADFYIVLPATARLQFGSAGIGSPDVSLDRPAPNRARLASGDVFNLAPTAFAALPTGAEGDVACVTDSSTATWGATITGGGANNVIAFFNGTNWKVMGA